MILTDDKIRELIKEPVNSKAIFTARTLQNDASVHFTGENYMSLITRLIGKESAQDYNNKRELSEPISKPIAETIYNQLTMFFRRGGDVHYYEFGTSKNDKQEFEQTIDKIYNGKSLHEFTKNWFSKAIHYRFNDFIVITRPKLIGRTAVVGGIEQPIETAPKRYIITVSIDKVKDYKKTGDKVEYLIYEYERTSDYTIYRVIDDEKDTLYKEQGSGISPVTLENGATDSIPHKKIPVRHVGTNLKDINDSNVCQSVVDTTIPLLRRYIKFDAINILTEINTSYSLPWSIGSRCTECGGETTVMKDGEKITCPKCKGSGYEGRHRPGEMFIIPAKIMETERPLTTTPAGIIEGSIDTPKFQAERLQKRLEQIYETALGVQPYQQLQKTATEIEINIKPLEDRNSRIAEMCEKMETWVCGIVGEDYASYKGSSIVYNKKLNLRSEASIVEEIKKSKDNGATQSYIYSLVEEMIYNRFSNDKLELQRQLLLLELEPLAGYTIDEVMKMQYVSDEDKYVKQNFTGLLNQISKTTAINENNKDAIKVQLIAIATEKLSSINQKKENEDVTV